MNIAQASAQDRAPIDHLLDLAFGADRRTRTAYRLREGVEPIAELSLVAYDGDMLVGSLQCWPIALRAGDCVELLTLLGPVAAHPARQNQGIGTALMDACLARADAGKRRTMLLIGDAEYYGRWGFTPNVTGGWRAPGPVERHRLLARLAPDARLAAIGTLGPATGQQLAA